MTPESGHQRPGKKRARQEVPTQHAVKATTVSNKGLSPPVPPRNRTKPPRIVPWQDEEQGDSLITPGMQRLRTEQVPSRLLMASSRSLEQNQRCVPCPEARLEYQCEHRGRGAPRENLVPAGLAVAPVPASLIGRSILQISKKGLFPRWDVCLLFSDVGLRQGSI